MNTWKFCDILSFKIKYTQLRANLLYVTIREFYYFCQVGSRDTALLDDILLNHESPVTEARSSWTKKTCSVVRKIDNINNIKH